jgi:hypothetical protein
LDRVYRAVASQSVDQIRYNIENDDVMLLFNNLETVYIIKYSTTLSVSELYSIGHRMVERLMDMDQLVE